MGQLGLGDRINHDIPIKVANFNNIIQVSCGGNTAFVTTEGLIYTWGFIKLEDSVIRLDRPSRISYIYNVIQVSCGSSHIAFINNEGCIYTFGYNNFGQLGLNDTSSRFIPTQIPGFKDIISVSCGGNSTAFIKK